MLAAALADPNPVLIFEHVMLYNRSGELPADAGPVDIRRAIVRRPGKDVTLVTYGGTLFKTLDAAETLAKDGVEAEVVDLRVLRPLDGATLLASVRKTRRAVIVDEGWRSGSFLPKSVHGSWRRHSGISTRRLVGCAAPRCRFPIPITSKRRHSLNRQPSSRRRRRRWAGDGRVPHALARRRHGSRDIGRMAEAARRSREARRYRRRCRDPEGCHRNRHLRGRRDRALARRAGHHRTGRHTARADRRRPARPRGESLGGCGGPSGTDAGGSSECRTAACSWAGESVACRSKVGRRARSFTGSAHWEWARGRNRQC